MLQWPATCCGLRGTGRLFQLFCNHRRAQDRQFVRLSKMNHFSSVYTVCLSLALALIVANQLADVAVQAQVDDINSNSVSIGRSLLSTFDDDVEEELESELQLKKMLSYVTPLMSIFVRKRRSVRSTEDGHEDDGEFVEEARAGRGGKRQPSMPPSDRTGYGDYGSASSYGGGGGSYGGGCCNQKDDLLPILALTALSLLLLYLIAIATTTTTISAGRKRRSKDDNEIDENDTQEIGRTN